MAKKKKPFHERVEVTMSSKEITDGMVIVILVKEKEE